MSMTRREQFRELYGQSYDDGRGDAEPIGSSAER